LQRIVLPLDLYPFIAMIGYHRLWRKLLRPMDASATVRNAADRRRAGDARGRFGPAVQWAIEHQIKVGEYLGAGDFVPVSQAHIMADTESLGPAGVEWLERMASLPRDQRRLRVPAITDPRGTDFAAAHRLKQQPSRLRHSAKTPPA
jgi:hypothetical protein